MYMLPVPWLGPPLAALRFVMYFRFCDDVMFSYHGANGPESSTLSLEEVGQVHAVDLPVRRQNSYSVWWSSSECGRGGIVCNL